MKNLFVILIFVLLLFSPHIGAAQVSSSTPEQKTLERLPDDVLNTELQLFGGKTLKLSEYSGKVVLLNVFATWCGPCRFESPDLAKLHRIFKDRGVVVIELTPEDPKDSQQNLRLWIQTFRLPYSVGWAPKEVGEVLLRDRGAIPQSFLIARDGRILNRFIGFDRVRTFAQMGAAIENALK